MVNQIASKVNPARKWSAPCAGIIKTPFQHDCALQADFRGLKCPLPVLKARRSLGQISSGQEAEFLTDDPASPLDMAHFCETEGHTLLVSDEHGGIFIFVVKKQ
jgi:tRNA 2-thiouridine synthesizing protein A